MNGRECLKWDSRGRKKWREESFHNSWAGPWDTGHQLSPLNFHIRFQRWELMEDSMEFFTLDTDFSKYS